MAFDVLVVESDESFASELNAALVRAGFVVHSEDDADNAYAWAQRERPRLVIIAVELKPNRPSGFTLCRKLRQDGALAEMPIFITSAAVTEEVIEKHRTTRYPANRYFFKPVPVADLVTSASEFVSPLGSSDDESPGDALDLGFGDELESLLALDRMEAAQRSENLRLSQQMAAVPDSASAVTALPSLPPLNEPSEPASAAASVASTPVPGTTDHGENAEARLRAEVRRLQAEVEQARSESTLAQSQVVQAQQELHRLATSERELAVAQQQANSGRERVALLERQLTESQSAANSSSVGSAAAARELLTLRTALNRAEGEVLRYKDEVFARDHRLVEMLELSEQHEAESSRLQAAREEAVSARNEAVNALNDATAARDEATGARDEAMARVAALQSAVARAEEGQSAADRALVQAQALSGELQQRLAIAEQQAEQQAAQQAARLHEVSASAQAAATAHDEQVDALQKLIQHADDHVASLSQQVNQQALDLQSMTRQLSETTEHHNAMQRSADAVAADLAQAHTRLQESEQREAALRGELGQARERQNQLQSQVHDTQLSLDAANDALEEGAATREALQGSLAAAAGDNQQLLEQLNAARTAAAEASEQLTQVRAQSLATNELLNEAQQQIQALTDQAATSARQAAEQDAALESVRAELSDAQKVGERLTLDLQDANRQLHEASQVTAELSQQVQSAGERESQLIVLQQEIQQQLADVQLEKALGEQQLAAVTSERDTLRSEGTAATERIEELTTSLGARVAESTGLQHQVTALTELNNDLSATIDEERQQADTARAVADERLARMKDERDEHRQRAAVSAAELAEMSALADAERSRFQHQLDEQLARAAMLESVASRVAPLEGYAQAAESLVAAQAEDLAALRLALESAQQAIHSRDSILHELAAAVTLASEAARQRPTSGPAQLPALRSEQLHEPFSQLKAAATAAPFLMTMLPDTDRDLARGFTDEVGRAAAETGSVPVVDPHADAASSLAPQVDVPFDEFDDDAAADEFAHVDSEIIHLDDL